MWGKELRDEESPELKVETRKLKKRKEKGARRRTRRLRGGSRGDRRAWRLTIKHHITIRVRYLSRKRIKWMKAKELSGEESWRLKVKS